MQLFSNNADSALDGAITSATTDITLQAGDGAKFPTPGAGDYFLVTLFQKLGTTELNHEIVRCTARTGDVLTVVRAQEGTTAKEFNSGDAVELRMTAGTAASMFDTAANIHAAPSKATPVDADELGLSDSAASWSLKKLTFANLKAWIGGLFVSKSGDTMTGNLDFSGAGRRITGDFSNATFANRLMFQTSSANDASRVGLIPNGTSRSCEVLLINTSDASNAGVGSIRMNNGDFAISAYVIGAGTLVPMTFNVGGAERLRIDPTTGNVTATNGALGYGVGNGGTAQQPTSITSNVILNKPNGVITLANGSITGSGIVVFQLENTFITENSIVVVHGIFTGTGTGIAQFTPQVIYVQTGVAFIQIKNNNAGSVSTDGVTLRFAVFAGSAS